MNANIKYGLSAAVLALIAAGASAPQILDQFLDEKEVTHYTHLLTNTCTNDNSCTVAGTLPKVEHFNKC